VYKIVTVFNTKNSKIVYNLCISCDIVIKMKTVYLSTNNKIPKSVEQFAFGFCEYPRIIKLHILLLRHNFFQCCVFAMKSVQNLKSFWRSSQNYFVLALFCSLHS
jgi:hypothetical protein